MANLADWIGQRFGLAPRAPKAAAFIHHLPATDTDMEDEEEEYLDEHDLQGQSFVIEYADSAGEISNRRITIRKLHRTADGCLCLRAFCWEREAPRAFRVDRILTLRRLSDPTPIVSPQSFFERYMHDGIDGAVATVLQKVRPGLRVLIYLARCDGSVHPAEGVVIKNYVAAYSPEPLHWDGIEAFVESQHPDRALAKSMLKAALANRANAERLLTAAKHLIDADGILAPEEVDGLEKLYQFSEASRYQEDIRH